MTTNQQIAAERFAAHQRDVTAFMFGERASMTNLHARAARDAAIDADHGFRRGWITVNGEAFNMEMAFPTQTFPRFPADQGVSS